MLIPLAGWVVASGVGLGGSRLLRFVSDPPIFFSFYSPPLVGWFAALVVALVFGLDVRSFCPSLSLAEKRGRVAGFAIGFSLGWTIGLALSGDTGAVLGAGVGSVLLSRYLGAQSPGGPRNTIGFSDGDWPGGLAVAQMWSGRYRLIVLLTAGLGAAALHYPFRRYLASTYLSIPGEARHQVAASFVLVALIVLLLGGALVGREATTTRDGLLRGAVLGGFSGFVAFVFVAAVPMGLLAAEPVLAQFPEPFRSAAEMDAALAEVAIRMLTLLPLSAGLLILAGAGLAALGAGLSVPEGKEGPIGFGGLATWRIVAGACTQVLVALLMVFIATALLPPAIRDTVRDAGMSLSRRLDALLDWLPSAWPVVVLFGLMGFAVVLSRARLPDSVAERRSVAWLAASTGILPWLALYPTWHLASEHELIVLPASAGSLMSVYLMALSWRLFEGAGGVFGPVSRSGLGAGARNALAASIVGAVAATPLTAFGITATFVVLPLLGTMSPEDPSFLRSSVEQYFLSAYPRQVLAVAAIASGLWVVWMVGFIAVRPLAWIYDRLLEAPEPQVRHPGV